MESNDSVYDSKTGVAKVRVVNICGGSFEAYSMSQANFLERYRVQWQIPDGLLSGEPEDLEALIRPSLTYPSKEETPG